tara:strand:+ start:4479 stop:5420 length:942 start_codon:yes stop_codon:yes gene_type:complete
MIDPRKKILIIGSSGQIGIELLSKLNKFNYSITALKSSQWHKRNTSNIKYVSLDITKDFKGLEKLVLDSDIIFHLAGNTAVSSKKENEINYFNDWISPLHNILNLIVSSEKILIFASSVTVYGVSPKLPITELSKEEPLTSYDLAKSCCDNLIRFYRSHYNVNCSSLRFSNVYGPQTNSGNESRRAINKILEIIHTTNEISIVSDGSYIRNYIHVTDAASMLMHVVENISKVKPILLCCSNENISFKDIILCLVKNYENQFNKKIKVNYHLNQKFITDTRSFSAMPSEIFNNNFKFMYDINKGFDELIKSIKV